MSDIEKLKKRLEQLKKRRDELRKKLKKECKECNLPIEYGILKTVCSVINDKECSSIVDRFGNKEISLEETISQLKTKLDDEKKKKFIEVIEFIEKYEKQ